MIDLLSPKQVLESVASALPVNSKGSVIIIGSLAAAYWFFAEDDESGIRTKDVDCMFVPHAKAVAAAEQVTEALLQAGWHQRPGAWSQPGDANTPDDQLPIVRLLPPGDAARHQWFLELLGAPRDPSAKGKELHRVETRSGHMAICSFNYLALAEIDPLVTPYGVRIARPEMMALANLLHHPRIDEARIADTEDKRSNKDLGRVLALAYLTLTKARDEGLESWHHAMGSALRQCFPDEAQDLALRACAGIRELLSSPGDLSQALAICNRGLLSSCPLDLVQFDAMGRLFVQRVAEPLEELAAGWASPSK